MTKSYKMACAPSEDRSAWASAQSGQSSLCVLLVATESSFLHANSEDSDQTGRMPRLIWVFAGRKCHFVGFAIRWRISCFIFVSLLRCNLQRFISQVRMIPQRNLWFCAYFKATRQLSTWKQRLICYVHVFVQSCFHGSSMHTWCSCLSPSATMPTVYSNQVTSSNNSLKMFSTRAGFELPTSLLRAVSTNHIANKPHGSVSVYLKPLPCWIN